MFRARLASAQAYTILDPMTVDTEAIFTLPAPSIACAQAEALDRQGRPL